VSIATNVEIKAEISDLHKLRELAESITDVPCEAIKQHDIFFNAPRGRLKLRVLNPGFGQLVYYERQDCSAPRPSNYIVSVTTEPDSLERVLAAALGVRGVVDKERYLYKVGNTRIHLDKVKGLGDYLELEVVLTPGQTVQEGKEIALLLIRRLGINEADLIDVAYIDLLKRQ